MCHTCMRRRKERCAIVMSWKRLRLEERGILLQQRRKGVHVCFRNWDSTILTIPVFFFIVLLFFFYKYEICIQIYTQNACGYLKMEMCMFQRLPKLLAWRHSWRNTKKYSLPKLFTLSQVFFFYFQTKRSKSISAATKFEENESPFSSPPRKMLVFLWR